MPVVQRRAHRADTRDSTAQQNGLGLRQGLVVPGRCGSRYSPGNEILRIIDEETVLDASTGGCRRLRRHAGSFHGSAVCDECVAIDALEDHWPIVDDCIEVRGSGEPLVWPELLVPASADDPVSVGMCRSIVSQALLKIRK